MVFQSYALFPNMSVYENIAFGLKVENKDKAYIDQRVHELADMVDLTEEQVQKNVGDLSGGQQQRVAITRALAKKPGILAMDEPLSNLDARLRKQLRVELKNIQNDLNVTTLYVTHDQEEALTLSDRIAVFSDGKLEQVGTPEEIYTHPQSEFVLNFVGDSNQLPAEMVQKLNLAFTIADYDSFYIRPENISTREGEAALSDHELVVDYLDEEYYGTHIIYKLWEPETGTEFSVHAPASQRKKYSPGDRLTAVFHVDEIKKFKKGE